MEYLFKCDDAATALILEGLAHLPINRALGLVQQMQSEMQRQVEEVQKPPKEPEQ
jgi:hypothetical protein